MPATQQDKVLDELRHHAEAIRRLEENYTRARMNLAKQRDSAILRAVMLRIQERRISAHAGVSRGWIHKLKKERDYFDDGHIDPQPRKQANSTDQRERRYL